MLERSYSSHFRKSFKSAAFNFLMAKKRSDHLLQQITQQATNSRGEAFRFFSKIFQNESVSLQNQGAFALNFRRQILKIGVESLLSIA